MKKNILLLIVLIVSTPIWAQNPALKVEKHVLENGFTVYLNSDKTAKNVYGAVVVKAGGKNDPADATGMAHYLEHVLFKGTTEMGTLDYAKEKPFLDSINIYYDLLGKTKDLKERQRIQLLINNQSVQAAKYGLPTEFDKLIKSIGGTGLNAFTTEDMTVYHNGFPGEEMEKWLDIYSHRFQNPVFRSFQAELEVVYEEKNISMDFFGTKLIETMNLKLFKGHPYGTQSVIGTVEHLKNPSLTKIYEYYNTYYVANNMALVLCGNFDSEKTLALIKQKFSKLRTGVIPPFPDYPKSQLKKKEVLKVRWTPIKVSLLGFKTVPKLHPDFAALEVLSNLLSNSSQTGKLDKLSLNGKVTEVGGVTYSFNDDGAFMLFVVPKLVGQSIKKAEKLVFEAIDQIKKGEISETELKIIKNELYTNQQWELENFRNRTMSIVDAFGSGSTWEDHLIYYKTLENVSKEDVVRVANTYFGNNYFAIHSRTGFPKKKKLEKPGYKPVLTDQKEESIYAKKFKELKSDDIEPKFLDFEKDASRSTLSNGNILYVCPNPVNDIFSLRLEFQVGTDSINNLNIADGLFKYFHTKTLNTEQLKEKAALLGLSYYAYANANRFTLQFSGIEKNLTPSLQLIHEIIQEAEVEDKALKTLVNEIKTSRQAEEKEPDVLGEALFAFARFGNKSSYIDRLSANELKKLKAQDILETYKKAITYQGIWHYAGNNKIEEVEKLLNKYVPLPSSILSTTYNYKKYNPITENTVYLMHDPKAIQSQMYFMVPSEWQAFDPSSSAVEMAFNEYMGGGFSGLILQEIRELRSLAYSAGGRFNNLDLNKTAYFSSYIGCQADKTLEAISVMDSLIRQMPQRPERMENIKMLLKKSISNRYPSFRYISYSIDYALQIGETDSRIKSTYPYFDSLRFEEVVSFYENRIQNRPILITVYGNKNKMDLEALRNYGKIVEYKREDILKE